MQFIRPLLILTLAAIFSHLTLIVFWSNGNANSPYLRVSSLLEPHKFYTLSEDFGADILQFESQDLGYAVCHYDLNDQALVLNANINDGFGILTVYSEFGEVIFSINSRQTKMAHLEFALLLEGAENSLPSGMVFQRITAKTGMIIIRLAVSGAAYHERVAQQLASARCDVMKSSDRPNEYSD
ncbi:MAG: DUF1254 domain-containing protein [Alphaproteobacteria bacterium]|nr:DUF1254 domain-containing protein [Alphaproteobacteria bacterium]